MDYRQNDSDRDELRARFTAWLDTLIRRAKLNYLRKTEIPIDIVSLDELFEENIPITEDAWMRQLLYQEDDFNFDEERLATAYAELPLMRQQILKFLYVDELTVGEIAKKTTLFCSVCFGPKAKRIEASSQKDVRRR